MQDNNELLDDQPIKTELEERIEGEMNSGLQGIYNALIWLLPAIILCIYAAGMLIYRAIYNLPESPIFYSELGGAIVEWIIGLCTLRAIFEFFPTLKILLKAIWNGVAMPLKQIKKNFSSPDQKAS